MSFNNQIEGVDLLGIISLMLGYENLIENRQQSKANDVQTANDKQAKYLLREFQERFEEQNILLKEILNEVRNENSKEVGKTDQ